jgi:hypothetical protein
VVEYDSKIVTLAEPADGPPALVPPIARIAVVPTGHPDAGLAVSVLVTGASPLDGFGEMVGAHDVVGHGTDAAGDSAVHPVLLVSGAAVRAVTEQTTLRPSLPAAIAKLADVPEVLDEPKIGPPVPSKRQATA